MGYCSQCGRHHNVGFISTRFAGTDGVSLETAKWAFEGFGNAFLEAVYFCRPIVVNTYSICTMDIKPKGFSVIEIDGYVSDAAVCKARRVLTDPDHRNKMVKRNYETAQKYFSYSVLRKKLKNLIPDCTGCSLS